MKFFGRTPGYYLFWTGVAYFTTGMLLTFGPYREYTTYMAPVWVLMLMLPFIIPPFGRWLNMDITWDRKMFDFLKKKDSNVVKFPEPKETPKMPYVAPPAPKPEPKTYYTFGLTDDNRVSFTMGYTTLTMNSVGVENLITQLEFFKSQLQDE